MSAPYDLFAACAAGLEPLLERELASLGALDPKAVPGGVIFGGHRKALFRVNLESGLASHVRVRVGRFLARSFEELERETAQIPWELYLTPGVPRRFRVTARKSRLHHTDAIAERLARVVAIRLGDHLAEPDPSGVRVQLRLERGRAGCAVDSTGEPLHRRGWRTHVGPAPLREDLARALLIASGWQPGQALWDPLCGSGTIAIEAATMDRGMAPGRLRRFDFERTPLFHAPTWEKLREAAASRVSAGSSAIAASDRDDKALEAARANAARAGVELTFTRSSLTQAEPPAADAGALVTNPPYGHRLGEGEDLRPLYDALGRRAQELPPTWTAALYCTEQNLGHRVSRGLRTAFVADAGGLKIRALTSHRPAEAGEA